MFTIDRTLFHENILIVTVNPSLDTASTMVRNIRNLANEVAGIQKLSALPWYRIIDFEGDYIPYIELVMFFAEEGRRQVTTNIEKRLFNVVCAKTKPLHQDIEFLQRRYRLDYPVYDDLTLAVHEIRTRRCADTTQPLQPLQKFGDPALLKFL